MGLEWELIQVQKRENAHQWSYEKKFILIQTNKVHVVEFLKMDFRMKWLEKIQNTKQWSLTLTFINSHMNSYKLICICTLRTMLGKKLDFWFQIKSSKSKATELCKKKHHQEVTSLNPKDATDQKWPEVLESIIGAVLWVERWHYFLSCQSEWYYS